METPMIGSKEISPDDILNINGSVLHSQFGMKDKLILWCVKEVEDEYRIEVPNGAFVLEMADLSRVNPYIYRVMWHRGGIDLEELVVGTFANEHIKSRRLSDLKGSSI